MQGPNLSYANNVTNRDELKASGHADFVIIRASYGINGIDAGMKIKRGLSPSAGMFCYVSNIHFRSIV